jgi:glycosyltransferase involved in cell wall biosynthesis
MSIRLIYDLSRLVTRVLNATPNGIDRVDWLLARHYLSHPQFQTLALGLGITGPRMLSPSRVRGATDRVAAAWRETSIGQTPCPAYEQIVARLRATKSAPNSIERIVVGRPRRAVDVAQALFRYGPHLGAPPCDAAPRGAFYLNAANFPLDWRRHVAWLDERSDIRPIFFVHDLLPVERPEWFWDGEPARHERRLDLLARRGEAALVASATVEQSLRRYLNRSGRGDMPIFRRKLPVSEIFSELEVPDPRLENVEFFVVCGTIEPRKNHMLLLDVWRELVEAQGILAPKLVVVGNRGWNSEKIVDALKNDALAGHVIEVAGLPTHDYKRLLSNARALLAPSFAEGFGLPVAEAISVGTPIIASDIPSFREQGGDKVIYLDPRSQQDWSRAIRAAASAAPSKRISGGLPQQADGLAGTAYLDSLDDFFRSL